MIPFLDLKAAYFELQKPIDAAIKQSLEEAHYILGPTVSIFEREFAEYVDSQHCVSVGSGLDALVMALKVSGITEGDEVIVPSHTFIATWLAVTQIGAIPKPVEPLSGQYNLTAEALEGAISGDTKAIVTVSLYGQASVDLSLREYADSRQLIIIEDAAQAHGASVGGNKSGSLADLATWSFYPAKNLGALDDGGAVTTNNPEYDKTLRLLRNYGSSEKYHHTLPGQNSRLGSIQSAILSVKLKKLDEWNARRCSIAQYYLDHINQPETTLPQPGIEHSPVWHLFVIQHPNRDKLQQFLLDGDIQTQIHYPIAPHNQACYQYLGITDEQLPIASQLAKTVLSLPIGPHMSLDDARQVVDRVNAFPVCS